MAQGGNNMIMAAASWISRAQTEKMVGEYRRSGALPALPPVEELFSKLCPDPKHVSSDWPSQPLMAEAALFLHWGFYENPHALFSQQMARRRVFLNFVNRSRFEPNDEMLFRQCFGFGYFDLQTRLSRYLLGPAIEAVDTLIPGNADADPDGQNRPYISCHQASESQIARILGDWERMEGDNLKVSNPALSRIYLERAGKTLHRCFENGERDTRFLAVLGLYEVDVGSIDDAVQPLEAAVKAGVSRPAAYSALAKLRLQAARAHPQAGGDRFDSEQLASILTPLFSSRKISRLDATGYELVAEAWTNSSTKPSLRNLAILKEGIAFYPSVRRLRTLAAQAYSTWGFAAEAASLAN